MRVTVNGEQREISSVSVDALLSELELVGVPRALGMGSYRLSVWTFDQLECGNVGAFQPRLQYGPADFTGYVTGMRH
jgi:hypothetical protein